MARALSTIAKSVLGKNYDVDLKGNEKNYSWSITKGGYTRENLARKKTELEKKIKFETLGEDLNKTSKTVNTVTNKWQSKESMDSTKDSIRNMQERLDAYKEYRELFGEEIELPQIDVSFSPVLENWDSITQNYGKFQNAEAFDKENTILKELGGMTSSDVKKQMGNTKKTKSDYDSAKLYNDQIREAQIKVSNARGKSDALNATNALNTAIKQRDDYAKSLGYKDYADLESKYNNSGIAYTTVDGENITWKNLYNTKKQKEQHDALYKEYSSKNDFIEYSEKGASIKNPTWEEAEGGVNLFGWRPGAEEVQNKVSYALDNKDTILGKEMFSPGGKPVGDLNLTTISDEEKQIYDYLLAREMEGLEKEGTSDKYLNSIYDVLKERYENKWLGAFSEYADEHPIGGSVLSVGQNLFAGAEYLKDSANYLKTGELDTNFLAQASSTIRGTVSQDIDSGVGKFVYNTGMSMADSAVAMATFGTYGGVSLGLSAAAQGTNDALARGLDDESAFLGGVASGVFEMLFETVSIGRFKKLADAPVDGVKSIIKNVGKSMLVNASEETLTELANITYDNLVNADFSEFKTQVRAYENSGMSKQDAVRIASANQGLRVAEAAASGALMGLGFGGVAGGKAYVNNHQIGATIKDGGNAQEMIDISSMPDVNTAYKAYTQYEKKGINADNIKNAQLGSLFTSAMQDTQKTLNSKNSTTEQKAIAEETRGRLEKVLAPSAKTVMETKGVKELVNDAEAVDALIESGLESEEGTRSYQLATEFKEKIKSGEKLTEAELSQLIKANDETFRAEEVVQREESQNVISEFAESMTEAEGKLFKEVYALNPDVDAEAYHNAYNLVQEYAKKPTAYPIDYVLENKGVLTATQASKIYNSVVMSESATRKESERLLQEARKNVGIGNINDSIMNYGNESVEGKVNWNELTQRQKFGFVYAKGLAQAIGANVTFVGKDKRFNGAYSKSKDRIYIDVYAGMDLETLTGTDFIVPVLGHELTHKMEIDSAKLYKAFSNHVLDALEKGGRLTKAEMIEAEIDRLKNLGRDHTEADAIGEIVARASEGLILQSKEGKRLFNSLSESEQKTVVSTIKDLINKLINWIDGLLNSYSLRSAESKTLKSMKAEYEQALKMWDKMLADMAAKNKARKESGEFDSKAVNKALTDVGLTFDAESESVAPSEQLSERTWTQSEYVQNRETAIKAIVKAIGVSEKDAARYVDNINGIARMIADDRARLDYDPNVDENASALKHNKEYKWTIDMSTLCAKRLLFTGTFDAIQKKMPNKAFNSEEVVALRSMMMERGYEVACGICYVESTRRELGPITEEFIERYKASQESGKPITKFNSKGKELILQEAGTQRQFVADKNYTPTLAELNTTDIDRVKTEHPDVYAAYLAFMKSRGQATPKLLETRTEYKGEILKHFNSKSAVKSRNDAGGLRVQSFSDFEVAHLIDMMQIVLDMSRVGLMSQAYTKVPAFADVFGNTGMKINLSLIAKDSGLDANGNLIFDDVEGMPAKEAFRLRNKYSKNVGTILVGKNDAHIRAALNDPRIDYVIPYHKSFWKESLYDALGLNGYENYTDTQNEKPFDKSRTIKNFQPSEYWDYSKSGKENADAYLKMCAEDGRVPKFPQFMKEEGYWKLLIDFKMYDNDGVGSPQMVVKPEFSMDEANAVMNAYEGGHREFPVAQDVVDDFVKQYEGKDDVQLSDRDNSYMQAVKRGDLETAQKMVDDAAKNAGFPTKVYHGTVNFGFTKTDVSKSDDKISFFATDSLGLAGTYSGVSDETSIRKGKRDTDTEKKFDTSVKSFVDKVNSVAGEQVIASDDLQFEKYISKIKNGKMDFDQISRIVSDYTVDVIDKIEESKIVKPEDNKAIWDLSGDLEMALYGMSGQSGNYGLYANTDGFLEIDGKGAKWSSIPFDKIQSQTTANTREIVAWAKENGYTGVLFKNIYDIGYHGREQKAPANVYAFLNPKAQIKSADAVTYDALGRVIPLSKRFNSEKGDLRYSDRDYSNNFVDKTIKSFGIKKLGDYIHVQRQVLKTLLAENFFTDTVNRRRVDINNASGMVIETNKSGIYETFNEKLYKHLGKNKKITKLATIRMLPQIIEQGTVVLDDVRNQYNQNDENKKFAYIEHTLEIDGKPVTILLDIKKTRQKNKFWVHRVIEKENVSNLPAGPKNGAETGYTKADIGNSISQQGENVKYSDRDYVAYDTTAILKETTIDLYLKDYASESTPNYAQAYITYMTPREFLELTTSGISSRLLIENESTKLDKKRFEEATHFQPIKLTIDHKTGEVISHEGRHRMVALANEGIYDVPVLLFDSSNKTSKETLNNFKLTGQFNEYHSAIVGDAIPFSYANRDLIIEKFGTQSRSQKINERFGIRETFLYSDRDDVDVYAIMGENARIRKENEKLKADIVRLKELRALEKKVTNGKVLKDNDLLAAARYLRKISDSRMDNVAVAKGLKNVYSYIMEAEQLDFEDVYRRCYAVADEMLKDVKPKTSEANDYAKRILKEIKGTRISLNENQKAEAKHRLGNNWLKQFFGKVIIAKDGISLDSQWQEWAGQYGDFFDADISDADQVVQLYETINSLKEASVFVEEYDTEEEKRWLATEIYNQYWNVSTVKTTADKYDKQIKLLKAEHKNTMTELRADYDARLKEQKASDKERYTKLVNDIKKRADKEVELAKKHGQEMLDRYKESADRKTTLKSIMVTVNSLNKKLKTNSKDVHIPESLKPVVINLLNAIDTSSKQLLTEGIFTNADLARDKAFSKVRSLETEKSSIYTLKKAIGNALRLFENAEKLASMSSDGLVDSSLVGLDIDMIEDIRAMINHLDALDEDGVKEFVLQKMNTKHLEILNNMVKRINHWAIIADKSLKNKHRERISTRSLKNIREMDSAGPRQEHIQVVEAMKNFFNWRNLLPVNAFKRLGPAATEFFEDLLESQGQCAFNTQEIMDFTDKLFKEYKLKNIKKWRTEEKTFELNLPGEEDTTTVKMPVSYIMTLYCISKQEDAKRHLYGVDENGIELTYTDENGNTYKGGGMTIKGYKESKFSTKVNKSLDNTVINEAIVKKITSVLTDEQKAVADALQKYMGEKGSEWGNAVSMALYGIEKFGVKDYFPITASPHTLNTDKVRDEKVSLFSILNYGFTKERNPDARNSIEIADIFEVFANHMHMVAIYNAYGLSIYDVARWINFKGKSEKGKDISVTKSIENAFGKGALTYVDNLIKDLNGQHLSNRLEFMSNIIKNTKVAMVGNSLSVTLLQPTAYIKAMIKISPLRMAKAAALPHLIKRGIERAQKYSGLALLKSQGYFETGISSSTATKIMHDESFLQKRIEGSLIGAEWADKITWGVLWNACEFEVRAKQKDLKVGSEEYFKAVAKKLDEVICETQVVDSPLTKSDIMRSPDTKAKEVTQFASELTVAYNIVHECIYQTVLDSKKVGKKQALKKNYKNLTKSLTSYVLISYVTAVVSTMISDFRFDDDDEEEEFTERVKDAFLQELILAGKIPYLRDAVSLLQGYDTTRTETLVFSTLVNAIEYSKKADEQIEKMSTAYSEEYKANAEKWAEIYDSLVKDNILKSISYASGYAFYNQWRDLRALLRLIGFMD